MDKELIQIKLQKQIEKFLENPSLKDLDDIQVEQLAKSLYLDKLKEDLAHEIKKYALKEQDLINEWLLKYSSIETQRIYQKNIKYFLAWLGKKEKSSLLDVNSKTADSFIAYIKSQKLSDNSKRLKISVCSSFFRQLVRWQIALQNPFLDSHGLPQKEIERKSVSDIPKDKDLNFWQKLAQQGLNARGRGSSRQRIGSKKALLTIKILRSTGLRVGAMDGLVIDPNGRFKTRSKGRTIYGKMPGAILRLITKLALDPKAPLKNYKRNTFAMWLLRAQRRYELKRYGPHTLRHKWAVEFYIKHKDIVALKTALGHKSLSSTQAYLASLEYHLK